MRNNVIGCSVTKVRIGASRYTQLASSQYASVMKMEKASRALLSCGHSLCDVLFGLRRARGWYARKIEMDPKAYDDGLQIHGLIFKRKLVRLLFFMRQ